MIGGFAIGAAPVASHPFYGGVTPDHPGVVFGGDYTLMIAYGEDTATADLVFGSDGPGGGTVFGGGDSRGSGYAFGGDSGKGKVVGGDERAG